jgi:hypothetical protein
MNAFQQVSLHPFIHTRPLNEELAELREDNTQLKSHLMIKDHKLRILAEQLKIRGHENGCSIWMKQLPRYKTTKRINQEAICNCSYTKADAALKELEC